MHNELRICLVSPLFHPHLGGVGREGVGLAEVLHSRGLKVTVMCRDIRGVSEWKPPEGLTVKKIKALGSSRHDLEAKSLVNILISLSFCLGLMAALIRHRKEYDIVHFIGAGLPLIISVLPLKWMKKKIIGKVAGAKMDREAGSFKGKYYGVGNFFIRVLKHVDAFVAVSREIREDLMQDGFIGKKIANISNSVSSEHFFPLADSGVKNTLRKKLNISEDKFVILSSGRLVPTKRIDVLLKAIADLMQLRKDIYLILLGDGELKEQLQAMATDLKIENAVVFKGFVPNVRDYLHASDMFVFPSEVEGMPNALLEAMACGLPVVATRIGGVVDVVEDKKNGLLVTAGDAEELKDAILKLLGDEQLSESMAEKAYESIRENYYIDGVADKYILLYKRVLNEL